MAESTARLRRNDGRKSTRSAHRFGSRHHWLWQVTGAGADGCEGSRVVEGDKTKLESLSYRVKSFYVNGGRTAEGRSPQNWWALNTTASWLAPGCVLFHVISCCSRN